MLAIIVKGFHLLVCIALIVIVLFQADKGEGLAGAFGGGASSTLFGERGGATEISKFTTGLAVIFMITSLIIAIWGPTWEKEADIARTNAYNSQPIVATPAKTPAPVTTPNATIPGLPMTTPVTNPAPVTATPAPVETPAPAAATPAPVETPAPAAVTPAPVETPAPAAVEENKPAETSAAPSVKEELKEKAENAVKAIVEEKKAEVIEAIKDNVENK